MNEGIEGLGHAPSTEVSGLYVLGRTFVPGGFGGPGFRGPGVPRAMGIWGIQGFASPGVLGLPLFRALRPVGPGGGGVDGRRSPSLFQIKNVSGQGRFRSRTSASAQRSDHLEDHGAIS